MVSLTFEGKFFVCSVALAERDIPKRAGFAFINHQWVTPSPQVAARLREYADERAENQFQTLFLHESPWSGRIRYPESETVKPFQFDAAKFSLARNRSYLAIDPGGGKTIISNLILNSLGRHPVVISVPPSLQANWEYELSKWSTWGKGLSDILIVPDSVIVDPLGFREKLYNRIERMTAIGGATLIIDEAHRFKSFDAQRTEAMLGARGLWRRFDRIILLSGTPMPNHRPMELFPILNRLAPETIGFRNFFSFGTRYCEAYKDRFGWHFDGAINVDELEKNVLGRFMLRIKSDLWIKDPAEEVVMLAHNAPSKVMALEKKVIRQHSPTDVMKHLASNGSVSTYRRMLGLAKVPLVISFVRELLDGSNESILLFAEHIEVVEKLRVGLKKFNPVVLTGQTSPDPRVRQGLVDKFQTDKSVRVFIGNTKAAGVGFNLTKASRVGLVEPSWVPAENKQAYGRANRIGQKRDVLVQYFCFTNSLDRTIIETNLRKKKSTQLI